MSDWQTRLKPLNVTKIHIQDTGQARPEGVRVLSNVVRSGLSEQSVIIIINQSIKTNLYSHASQANQRRIIIIIACLSVRPSCLGDRQRGIVCFSAKVA